MYPRQARKVRKKWYSTALHQRRKQTTAHLAEDLLVKYNRRSVPVRSGDTIKLMRGTFKGHRGKVSNVNTKKRKITVEGVTIGKSDGTQVAMPIDPSNVLITKLDLSDPWRRRKLEEGEKVKRKRKKEEKKPPAAPKKMPEKKSPEKRASGRKRVENS